MRVYKRKNFVSVGILKGILELLNILRKEGFGRFHHQRKGDALRCSDRPREKLSKLLT